MTAATRRLTARIRRRATPKPGTLPPPVPECEHPLLLRTYWAADRAEGAERRGLLALAAMVKRAALRELPREERLRVLTAAQQRLGVLV